MRKTVEIYEKDFTYTDSNGKVKTGVVGVSINFKDKTFWLWPGDKQNSTDFEFICKNNPADMVNKWTAMLSAMKSCLLKAKTLLSEEKVREGRALFDVLTSFSNIENYEADPELMKKFEDSEENITESHKIAILGVESY